MSFSSRSERGHKSYFASVSYLVFLTLLVPFFFFFLFVLVLRPGRCLRVGWHAQQAHPASHVSRLSPCFSQRGKELLFIYVCHVVICYCSICVSFAMATVMLSCVLCVSSAFGHWNSQSALVAVARRFPFITSFHAILLWIGPVWGCFQNRMTYIDCSQMTRRSVLSWLAFRPGAKVS